MLETVRGVQRAEDCCDLCLNRCVPGRLECCPFSSRSHIYLWEHRPHGFNDMPCNTWTYCYDKQRCGDKFQASLSLQYPGLRQFAFARLTAPSRLFVRPARSST